MNRSIDPYLHRARARSLTLARSRALGLACATRRQSPPLSSSRRTIALRSRSSASRLDRAAAASRDVICARRLRVHPSLSASAAAWRSAASRVSRAASTRSCAGPSPPSPPSSSACIASERSSASDASSAGAAFPRATSRWMSPVSIGTTRERDLVPGGASSVWDRAATEKSRVETSDEVSPGT